MYHYHWRVLEKSPGTALKHVQKSLWLWIPRLYMWRTKRRREGVQSLQIFALEDDIALQGFGMGGARPWPVARWLVAPPTIYPCPPTPPIANVVGKALLPLTMPNRRPALAAAHRCPPIPPCRDYCMWPQHHTSLATTNGRHNNHRLNTRLAPLK